MKYTLITIVILILLAGVGFVVWGTVHRQPQVVTNNEVTASSTIEVDNSDIVKKYIEEHISTLSPVKEVVGGKFYTTNIVTGKDSGVVSYEDGHNEFVADFSFTVDAAEQSPH
jgi:hypothetical protein